MNENRYAAYTYRGGEELYLTLDGAREQAATWNEKGELAFVGHMDDPSWEDLPETLPTVSEAREFSPSFVLAAIGPDKEAITKFAFDLLVLNGHELDHQDGGVMVYNNDGWD